MSETKAAAPIADIFTAFPRAVLVMGVEQLERLFGMFEGVLYPIQLFCRAAGSSGCGPLSFLFGELFPAHWRLPAKLSGEFR
jgi:hypothetical protein